MNAGLDPIRREMRQRLHDAGLRSTSARLAVLVELHERAGPLSHEALMERLGEAAFDRATIYRILSDLAEAKLLRRMDLGDKVWRFELDDGCRDIAKEHAHFLCDGCGLVACLPELELRPPKGDLPAALIGAKLQFKVNGRCASCLAP
jgi:Fur family transcriptional regulator, ferric uptake regulator